MNKDAFDEALLAFLYHGHWLERSTGLARSWKGFDWEAMQRLYEKGLIGDPVNKAKSVTLSEEGLKKAKKAFDRLFGDRADDG